METSAKSEVVTVCSWQFAGEDRLQSTAMILITRALSPLGIGATDPTSHGRLVPLLADRIARRENAVIYRARFPNEADSLSLGF